MQVLPYMMVACKKTFHAKYAKTQKWEIVANEVNGPLKWDKYGKLGLEDDNNFLSVLLQWCQYERNNSKYRVTNNRGIKKKQVTKKLAGKINKVSKVYRLQDAILGKIQYIEKSWKAAHDRENQTG